MKSSGLRANGQLVGTLLAFAAVGLGFIGTQMDDGPLRIALIAVIILLAMAVGSLIGIGLAQQEAAGEQAKQEWEGEGQHDRQR